MNIDYSTNSWHAKLYSSMFAGDYPENFCSYFRGLVFAFLFFPLNFLMDRFPRFLIWGISSLLVLTLFYASYLFGVEELKQSGIWAFLWGAAYVFPAAAAFLFASYCVGTLIFTLGSFLFKTPIMIYIAVKKNKVCPSINWKHE